MSDIVERLRNRPQKDHLYYTVIDADLATEAADEIERLRADIDNARLLFSEGKAFLLKAVSELITTVERSDAENAKLRAALAELLAMCLRQVDFNDDRDGLTLDRSRAALGDHFASPGKMMRDVALEGK